MSSLIGRRYGEGGHLTVVAKSSIQGKNPKHFKYDVVCSVCANDPEMFGDGVFSVYGGTLASGSVPCGCSVRYRWKPEQYRLRVERLCKEKKMTLIDFPSENVASKSLVTVQCQVDGHTWQTAINSLAVGTGCWVCRNSSYMLPDDAYVARIENTGSFVDGTRFRKLAPKGLWETYCPTCASDKISKAGLGTGYFKSKIGSLLKRMRPCRCSDNHILSKDQCEFTIKESCPLGVTFLGWDGEFKGITSPFKIRCETHGELSTLFRYTGKTAGVRCPQCSYTSFFKSQLPSFVYILKVDGELSFTGFGITNFVEDRLRDHAKNLAKKGCNVVEFQVFDIPGRDARPLEMDILRAFPKNSQDIDGFRREATHAHLYDDVVAFVQAKLAEISEASKEEALA